MVNFVGISVCAGVTTKLVLLDEESAGDFDGGRSEYKFPPLCATSCELTVFNAEYDEEEITGIFCIGAKLGAKQTTGAASLIMAGVSLGVGVARVGIL